MARNFLVNFSTTAADYERDNPTPVEAYARKAFKGLCLQCQMIFATWKHPSGIMMPCHKRKSAHHSFEELESCWCPLCRMLLSNLLRFDDARLQELRLPERYKGRSDVNVYHHHRLVPCYYVELVFDTGERYLKPYFMMFPDGELHFSSLQRVHCLTCARNKTPNCYGDNTAFYRL
jgi:hypothetical protein